MDEQVKCCNCNWEGKRNALLKHLRMKPECKSMYDMNKLNADQEKLKKIRKQCNNATHYAKNKEYIKQNNEANKEERRSYKRKYDAQNKERIQEYHANYYQENSEERKQYQREYDDQHKESKKEYKKLKAHYRKYENCMEKKFQEYDIAHFKSHIHGWCNWNKKISSHDYRWKEIGKQCTFCNGTLFQFECEGSASSEPYKVNALHCLTCYKVTCNLCGESVEDYKYYTHFYLQGVNSDLREQAKLCPYRTNIPTYIEKDTECKKYVPCEICSDEEIKKEYKQYMRRVGVKHRYFLNMKTLEERAIMTNSGRDIFICPYTDMEVQSTICLKDAVQKLERRLNKGKSSVNNPEYIRLWEPHYARHDTEFDLMCDMKKHIELHTTGRVETHVVELTLATPYKSLLDLEIIDKLIKVKMENLEQVSSIKSIIPADKCLGLKKHKRKYIEPQEPWLACINPRYITYPVPKNVFNIKGPDGEVLSPLMDKDEQRAEKFSFISKEMTRIKEEKKTVYMIIHTHEGVIANPIQYFEESAIYPSWVEEVKLLFTWSVKSVLEETNKSRQKSLIQADFIQSQLYPSYIMSLPISSICNCVKCDWKDIGGISSNHINPVNGCSLPIKTSPLQDVPKSIKSNEELWESMFKFSWKLKRSLITDSSVTFDSDTESESSENDDEKTNEDEESEECDEDDESKLCEDL